MKLCLTCNFQFEDEQELCPKDFSKLVPLGKDQLIGKVIQDRYRIDCMIAKGSMGVVYKATQELIGREVAVKVLHGYLVADEESIKRFHKEAKAASRLNHPNITTLYDYGVLSTGQPYMVMDLLRGSSLADILKNRRNLTVDETLMLFNQVCDAMGEAHKRGVVHRDIKPENIMIENTERGTTIKVVDFGIAKFLQEQDDTLGKITKTGTVCGSPTYMSPEQCDDNQVDHRSDLYSLGVVLFETITGQVPFSSSDIYNVMTMHVKDPPPRLNAVRPDVEFPPYMQAVVDKAMAKRPNDRFQSAQEFYEALCGKGAVAVAAGSAVGAGAGAGGRLTEEEVKNVVARAIEKRAQQQQQPLDPNGGGNGQSNQPEVHDLVRQKVEAATAELLARRSQTIAQESQRGRIRRTQVTPAMRLVGMLQQVFPIILTICLFGVLVIVLKNEAGILSVVNSNFKVAPAPAAASKSDSNDVDDLVAQSKFEQARAILEKRKKDGSLTADDATTLDVVYTRLAKKEAKAKHYKQAVQFLTQESNNAKDDDEVKALLKKYKRAAGIR